MRKIKKTHPKTINQSYTGKNKSTKLPLYKPLQYTRSTPISIYDLCNYNNGNAANDLQEEIIATYAPHIEQWSEIVISEELSNEDWLLHLL